MTRVYIQHKMIEQQWLQLKMYFVLGDYMKVYI